jgi:hypothetical protein
MSYKLTSRAERLIDEFNEAKSARHGIAKVLKHVANAYSDEESFYAVPASLLTQLAEELSAPSVLDRALAGDVDACRQFLYEAGFTDEHGQLRPPYRSEDLDD